ncbi:YkvA family protein [Reichenbachiella carrageenanivorans]|uniref:YkvA family protein n=1 Tax=Reichenbachiella carrageenanivorans TaxID=2979869 RepID=A0ABY6D6H0_9BACT|nr:YkvA family protein [Reichenbachiella carrageenanivorans]UXX81210.1 YkvA family protein [Reichenbachiella carrageenanivorans]
MSKKEKFKKYQEKAAEVLKDNERVQSLLGSTKEKLVEVLSSNERLKDFSDKVYVMVRMVKAHLAGDYREFPWRTILLMVGALIYFITPIDMIPDVIPVLGLTDDISIIFWIYRSVQEDIEKFEDWERTIELS